MPNIGTIVRKADGSPLIFREFMASWGEHRAGGIRKRIKPKKPGYLKEFIPSYVAHREKRK